MKLIYTISLLFSIYIMAGCEKRNRLENCNKLKVDDPKIIEFANKCSSAGRRNVLNLYEKPEVTEKPDNWWVFYKGKPSVNGSVSPGHWFRITIDRKTCECAVHGGM